MSAIAIAIVDDTSAAAEAVACMLRISGIKDMKLYGSGKSLLDEMSSGFRPDFVITDFLMPEMNGVVLLDAINERYGFIPSIIITGNPELLHSEYGHRNTYPVLCKGRSDFFLDLMTIIGKSNFNGKRILSAAAEAKLYKKLAVQC